MAWNSGPVGSGTGAGWTHGGGPAAVAPNGGAGWNAGGNVAAPPDIDLSPMALAASDGQYLSLPSDNTTINNGHGNAAGVNAGTDTGAEAGAEGGNGGGCRRCGEDSHEVRDCPQPDTRPCFNCGETGHRKDECTNPSKFTGECRVCSQIGHRANECPEAPAKKCRNCDGEGHTISQCKNPRSFKNVYGEVADDMPEKVWEELKTAAEDRDMDDAILAFWKYAKGTMPNTYVNMEKAFRTHNVPIWIIAIEKEMASTYSNMDLQGNMGKKYTANLRFSPNPLRPKEIEGWPASPEENLARLADAGTPVDSGIIKCRNCEELGHSARECPEEKREVEHTVVKCYNCEGIGHRMRDCPNDRVDKFACRNCKQSGHSSRDCPEPRSAEGVECKRCNETGHFAKDCPSAPPSGCRNCGQDGHMAKECPEPRNPATMTCRNCDEVGHVGKDCPKPRDYSRVKCSNCQQMGHTKVRCKVPLVEENDHSNAYNADGYGGDSNPADTVDVGDVNTSGWASGGGNAVPEASAETSGWASGGGGGGAW